MVFAMSDETIIADLERLVDDNQRLATHHRTEFVKFDEQVKKYRAALSVIRGDSEVTSKPAPETNIGVASKVGRKSGPTSTLSMIRSVLGSSMTPLNPVALADRMALAGWSTNSENPANTVRTALMRLVEKGELQRHDGGTYSLSLDPPVRIERAVTFAVI